MSSGSVRPEAFDTALVLLVKALVSGAVLASGFYAISDDDFSRTVIAMQFAHSPSFDPSGTSWLPAPFWITGSAMLLFGRSLAVARAVAVTEGLVFAALVHRGARTFGLRRSGAVLAAIVATSIPTAARLSVAFQPEALTAGLVAFSAFASRSAPRTRLWAALGLFVACLSRYEAWPAALSFALVTWWDSRFIESKRRGLLTAAAVALLAPGLWLLHGVFAHGDALFFLHRVAAYRAALGVDQPFWKAFFAVPLDLALSEPALVVGAVVLHFRTDPERTGYARPLFVLGSVIAFLVAGNVLGGAPTHHPERALLAVYAGLAVVGTNAAIRLVTEARPVRVVDSVVAMALAWIILGSKRAPESFTPRTDERAIGVAARARLPENARVLVDTADYGYFAVLAAFGAPERAEPLASHDPRIPRAADPFASPEALSARVARARATALIVDLPHFSAAFRAGRLLENHGRFALVDLSNPPAGE